MSDDDEAVGYGNPPKESRFRPGRSGNPNGRPPRPRPEEVDPARVLDEPVRTQSSGSTRYVPAFEHMFRDLANQAMQGRDIGSIQEFLRICKKYDILKKAVQPPMQSSVLRIPKTWDDDEWMEMFLEHGPPPWPGERDGLPDEAGLLDPME